MPIYALGSCEPDIHETAFVHPDAVVIGRVRIGPAVKTYVESSRAHRAGLRRLDR